MQNEDLVTNGLNWIQESLGLKIQKPKVFNLPGEFYEDGLQDYVMFPVTPTGIQSIVSTLKSINLDEALSLMQDKPNPIYSVQNAIGASISKIEEDLKHNSSLYTLFEGSPGLYFTDLSSTYDSLIESDRIVVQSTVIAALLQNFSNTSALVQNVPYAAFGLSQHALLLYLKDRLGSTNNFERALDHYNSSLNKDQPMQSIDLVPEVGSLAIISHFNLPPIDIATPNHSQALRTLCESNNSQAWTNINKLGGEYHVATQTASIVTGVPIEQIWIIPVQYNQDQKSSFRIEIDPQN